MAAPQKQRVSGNATTMAAKQREISISEFFTKNRHLLGFDSPAKALLTTIKEAVDNSLDACEEAGILPEILVATFDQLERVYTEARNDPIFWHDYEQLMSSYSCRPTPITFAVTVFAPTGAAISKSEGASVLPRCTVSRTWAGQSRCGQSTSTAPASATRCPRA